MREYQIWENFADFPGTFASPFFNQAVKELRQQMGRGLEGDAVHRFAVRDTGSAFVVDAELPGIPPEALEVTLTGTVLRLQAERKAEAREGYTAHRRERRPYQVQKSITLPVRVDAERVSAAARNGVITITLPKAADAQPRTISVKTA